MKKMAIVMLWGLAAAGCSDEADIGLDSQPIGCMTDPTAKIAGEVDDPNTGTTYPFEHATPTARRAVTGGQVTVQLSNDTLLLRFAFYCGQSEIARYGVKGDTQEGLDCPLEVASVVLGRIEYLPAKSGTLYVDQNSNCFAGRFRVDFGDNGALGGWFSAPWIQ
jgi:hypothetical protein